MRSPADDRVTFSQDDPVGALVEGLRGAIAEAEDPERAPQMQAYMKSELPFRGVSAVPLRKICRSVLDTHRLEGRQAWERAVRVLWDEAAFREERYAAIALAGHRVYRTFQDASTLDLYRHLVVTGAWWDLVDDIAAHRVGSILRSDPATVTPLMRTWARDDDLWVRRTAVLCQLASKDATDTALLGDVLAANLEGSPHGREFFIRKAVGWALREYAKTDPEWVLSFVSEHDAQLSGLTRREALKHLR
jgi:3-methyladenine DNA glycosylase AlkD